MSLDEDTSISFSQEKVAAISKLMKSSSPDAEFRRIALGILKNAKKLTKTQRKHAELSQLIHGIEVASLKKEACEEKLGILEEYAGFVEEHIKDQERKK